MKIGAWQASARAMPSLGRTSTLASLSWLPLLISTRAYNVSAIMRVMTTRTTDPPDACMLLCHADTVLGRRVGDPEAASTSALASSGDTSIDMSFGLPSSILRVTNPMSSFKLMMTRDSSVVTYAASSRPRPSKPSEGKRSPTSCTGSSDAGPDAGRLSGLPVPLPAPTARKSASVICSKSSPLRATTCLTTLSVAGSTSCHGWVSNVSMMYSDFGPMTV
mmetsp:Transcript_23448/g.51479  ORF Transcript_23448/g.51479 Transcript_23448/m.51479 type:complete len:220 (-) Transcript_23448:492-1151(-)